MTVVNDSKRVILVLMERDNSFSMAELCKLVEMSPRTIRFYITQGLVDAPGVRGRGAKYGAKQLEQLLTIQKWQQSGLNLEAIKRLLQQGDSPEQLLPRDEPGTIKIWSRITLASGIELHIQPEMAQLTPQQLRQLNQTIQQWLAQQEKNHD
ncbi:MAG: MerR family transcriptional regulator [Gammaproteobacteria bacterium]|nr:MerR family transcriptional regulator [Gammaproteobacteria bacterium]